MTLVLQLHIRDSWDSGEYSIRMSYGLSKFSSISTTCGVFPRLFNNHHIRGLLVRRYGTAQVRRKGAFMLN